MEKIEESLVKKPKVKVYPSILSPPLGNICEKIASSAYFNCDRYKPDNNSVSFKISGLDLMGNSIGTSMKFNNFWFNYNGN